MVRQFLVLSLVETDETFDLYRIFNFLENEKYFLFFVQILEHWA